MTLEVEATTVLPPLSTNCRLIRFHPPLSDSDSVSSSLCDVERRDGVEPGLIGLFPFCFRKGSSFRTDLVFIPGINGKSSLELTKETEDVSTAEYLLFEKGLPLELASLEVIGVKLESEQHPVARTSAISVPSVGCCETVFGTGAC